MRKVRETSPLRHWDSYWKKKWEEERKQQLTNNKKRGIIKA